MSMIYVLVATVRTSVFGRCLPFESRLGFSSFSVSMSLGHTLQGVDIYCFPTTLRVVRIVRFEPLVGGCVVG